MKRGDILKIFKGSRHPIVFTKEPQNPVPQAEREDASSVGKGEQSVSSL